MADIDFLEAIRRESALFVDAAASVPLETPVPTCPGWKVEDLVSHLASVQSWAAAMVEVRAAERLDRKTLASPPAGPAVLAWMREATARLLRALEQAGPSDPMWFWTGHGTVADWRRRQAQEAAVHRWDAQDAAGPCRPLDAALAADGVDELLTLHLARGPERFVGEPGTLHLRATDAAAEWLLTVGPVGLRVEHRGGEADVTARATASDLDLFLWGRLSVSALRVDGSMDLLERFQRLTAL